MSGQPVGLSCPGCGHPPIMILAGGRQCFCGTETGCRIITWDATMTLDELLEDIGTVDLSRWAQ